MGLLNRVVLAASLSASCYSPDTRDCSVSCSHPLDCANGQVCGSDHFCASPEMAGRCGSLPPLDDAGLPDAPGRDAPPRDAPADARPPDAPTGVALQIQVMGAGTVALDAVGSCDKDCTLYAPFAMQATLRAEPKPKQAFDRWTQGPCVGQGATCTFVPLAPVTIAARFIKADG
ncbi:MAG: hypothetical protein ACM31C_27060 [Acidobacteriota bacterium]